MAKEHVTTVEPRSEARCLADFFASDWDFAPCALAIAEWDFVSGRMDEQVTAIPWVKKRNMNIRIAGLSRPMFFRSIPKGFMA